MKVTDAQVRKFMEEYSKTGNKSFAAMKAGIDRKTGQKYLKSGEMPSQRRAAIRSWRTREDPFEAHWPEVEEKLIDAPELEAKILFEWLMDRYPDHYQEGQLRTLQRRVKHWRATKGPDKELFFEQLHRPGEAMQTDFTWATELDVTIDGEPFPHMLCHPVLPYSNWEWLTVCRSESLAALKRGVQEALFRLGRVPEKHQTDNTTAATHDLQTGKRGFNEEYRRFVDHFGMEPVTTAVGAKEQNGDVEALNGALKRKLEQHLQLRGSRDFPSVSAWESWGQLVVEKANVLRSDRVAEELAVMRPLQVSRLPEYTVERVTVSKGATIRVKRNTYSVPSRLQHETVKVHIHDDRLAVYYGNEHMLDIERLHGTGGNRIDYRHIIWSLVQKPGAFPRYRYREGLFPTITFRQAYDALCEALGSGREADIEYLRILHRAAAVSQEAVERTLTRLLAAEVVPLADRVKEQVQPETPEIPEMEPYVPDPAEYDSLLGQEEEG